MLIKKTTLVIFCCGILFSQKIFAQSATDTASTDSTAQTDYYDVSHARVEFYVGDEIENFREVDTSLQNFQQYNPARNKNFAYTYLTNIGAATQPDFFELYRTVGFDQGRNQFDLYRFSIDSVKYYRANTPYTNLFYVIGTNSEQVFAATHTQNFGPQLNATIDFRKIASEGYYLHDKKQNSNIAITAWYHTKNNLYRVQTAFVHNKIENDENGGLQFDGNVFTEDSIFDYNVNRSSATTNWKNFDVRILQTLEFAKKREYAINDSTTDYYHVPYLQLQHTIGYHDDDYLFEDPSTDTSYYPGKFVVMDTLRDMSDVDGFYNRISIGSTVRKVYNADSSELRNFHWKVFFEHQQHELADQNGNFTYTNLLSGFYLHQTAGNILYDAMFAFDANNEAYDLHASAVYTNKYIQPSVGFRSLKLQPTLLQDYYYGFNNRWENSFDKTSTNEIFIHVQSPAFHAGISFRYISLYEYIFAISGINNNAVPVQLTEKVDVLQIVAEKDFEFGDFVLKNRVGFQNTDNSVLYLPQFLGNHSWYYKKNLFKSALLMQTGIDVFYSSASVLYSYDIITGLFATGENATAEFYPRLDVFASFDIKTFRMFLKLENVAQGILGDGFYEAEGYPMQGRSFKFGVNWMLYY